MLLFTDSETEVSDSSDHLAYKIRIKWKYMAPKKQLGLYY